MHCTYRTKYKGYIETYTGYHDGVLKKGVIVGTTYIGSIFEGGYRGSGTRQELFESKIPPTEFHMELLGIFSTREKAKLAESLEIARRRGTPGVLNE